MHLTVFGATGGTGRHVIREALHAGHSVTAPVRDPSRITTSHPRLRTVPADVFDPSTLAGTADGADAVLSALGAPAGREPTTVYSTGVANILDVMRAAGVQRFICLSAVPVTPRNQIGALERRLVYPILYRFFGAHYADMARMEELLRRSDVDWTVVRPPRLTDRPATGRYRTATDHPLRRGSTISRADLATEMLRLLDGPHAVGSVVHIGY